MSIVRRSSVLGTWALVPLALVVTCTSSPTKTTAGSTGPATTVTTEPAPATAAATSVPATTTARKIYLDADGLGVISFGAAKDATIAALAGILGAVDSTGQGCELAGPGTTTANWKELHVQFVSGRFDSYTVRPLSGTSASLGLATRAGIGLKSTVAALKSAYGDQVKIPGLPPEFGGKDFAVSFPGTDRKILGTLTATSADGQIEGIFTQVCE